MKPLLAVLAWLLAADVSASWRESLPDARVVGQGDLRVFGFRIYTARLWSGQAPFDPGAPFALELTYHRSISREQFVSTSLEEIRRVSRRPISDEQLRRWEAELSLAFIDVEPGDRITGLYLPGRGCRFYAGERLLREIDDPALASAFFDIWLDPRSRDPDLRRQLLGIASTQ